MTPIIAYGHPCPSAICTAHGAPCYTGGSGTECAYDSIVPFKFSGAMMLGKYKYKYGYFEMRFRLPNINNGSPYNAYGPNFWMWASDNHAVYSEIDIFEMNGTTWQMDMNFHYRKQYTPTMNWQDTAFWHGIGSSITVTSPYPNKFSGPYNGGTWHTVGCEWTPDYIDTYYDSNDTTRRFSVTKLPINQLTAMPLIIDNYMPAAQYCIPFNNSFTQAPFTYDIDYVKVYQVKQVVNCTTTPGNFLNTSSSTYQSILYRDLTIGGVGGSAIFSNGSHHLAGQDFVLLQEGFEASGASTTVIVSTKRCQPDQTITYNINNPNGELDSRIRNDMRTSKIHYGSGQ